MTERVSALSTRLSSYPLEWHPRPQAPITTPGSTRPLVSLQNLLVAIPSFKTPSPCCLKLNTKNQINVLSLVKLFQLPPPLGSLTHTSSDHSYFCKVLSPNLHAHFEVRWCAMSLNLKHLPKELMLSNCGAREDSREFFGLQDQISQS